MKICSLSQEVCSKWVPYKWNLLYCWHVVSGIRTDLVNVCEGLLDPVSQHSLPLGRPAPVQQTQHTLVLVSSWKIWDCVKQALCISLHKTRGPRGPWNAHLRVKIFKSSLFSLLYIQQATPGGSKSEVMFKKEFSKIWPGDLVFDLTWPIFKLGLDIIKTNLLTKFHQNRAANVASRV